MATQKVSKSNRRPSAAERPKVSILCLTYNHKNYIEQTINSFLSQNTNFTFEVLIHDDASTDGSTEIIKRLESAHSDIIKPIYQSENQYSKGVKITPTYQLPRVMGEYVAICEGDDYWTDPNKLQLQVNFLDSHPDYSLVFHPVRVFYENGDGDDTVFPDPRESKSFTLTRLLKSNFIQTNSVMYRRQNYSTVPDDIIPGDWYLHLFHAKHGKIGFINKVMAAYRRHPGGIWWESDKNINEIWKKHGLNHLTLYIEMMKLFQDTPKHETIIAAHIYKLLESFARINDESGRILIRECMEKHPNEVAKYIQEKESDYERQVRTIANLHAINTEQQIQLEVAAATAENLKTEITEIKDSKLWKVRSVSAKVRKPFPAKRTTDPNKPTEIT